MHLIIMFHTNLVFTQFDRYFTTEDIPLGYFGWPQKKPLEWDSNHIDDERISEKTLKHSASDIFPTSGH